ncbi:hypothetical protein K9M47_00755 [Candidatus Gracilibacteria bacterium]|nr:hypothetical protein [Candidatus Gracilibacteria bacterium]MCF7898339.1 hypothetical protein [Candidatus Paceibacterota bacterium]
MRDLKNLVFTILSLFKRGVYSASSLYLKGIGFMMNFSTKILSKIFQFFISIKVISSTCSLFIKLTKYFVNLLPTRFISKLEIRSKVFNKRVVVGFGLPLATFFIVLTFVHSATYSFTQSSWTGGADTTATSTHASNQTNWNKYYSSTGLEVNSTVSLPVTSYAFTDDGATSTSPTASTTGGGFLNGTFASTTVTGSGVGSSIALESGAAQIGEGVYTQHTCVVKSDSTVYCWGNNSQGQLGIGTSEASKPAPVQVRGVSGSGFLTNIIQVAGGNGFTCAVKNDGTVYCWGG